jgi:selenocysteine lyase/cysteine desulfurase
MGSRSPVVAFARQDADKRFSERLGAAGIRISVYPNRIRIAPSVYNSLHDVDRLASALS